MKARIIDPQVKVYSTTDENSLSIATLQAGSEVEFGATKRKSGKLWIPITLSTGQQAFLPGDTRLFLVREGLLMQNSVDVHSEPSSGSPVKMQLKRNVRLSILEVIKEGGQDWVKVRDATGNEGYIPGDTRFKLAPQRTKAMGRRNMISGVMWVIAGIVIVFTESSSASASGFYLFGYAALLFGAVMLISGVMQYVRAPS